MNTQQSTSNRKRLAAGIGSLMLATLFFAVMTAFAAGSTPKIGDTAPDFALTSLDGKKITLSSLTRKTPVTLVVLRGFPGYQCPICSVQVGELIAQSAAFSAANSTQVVLVYPGPSRELQQRANEFVRGKNLPANFRLVIDPDYAFVNRYGLRWNAAGETAYPSTFVINKSGKVVFAKVSQSHGGRARTSEILAALPK